VGTYRKDCGGPNFSQSGGTCALCTNLPLNHRWTTSGGNSDSCDSIQCEDDCGIGKYRENCGNDETQISPGECKDCTGLRTDYYWTSSGPFLDICESLPCPACNTEGTFRVGCGDHSHGVCELCTSHTTCNADEYIEGCTYTSPGHCTSCHTCENGEYKTNCGGAESGTCVNCDASSCAKDEYLSGCEGQSAGNCAKCNKPTSGGELVLVVGVEPTDIYTNHEGCPRGSHVITDSQKCRDYAGSGFGNVAAWSNRPNGCWKHTVNGKVYFNTKNVINGDTMVGNDKVICEMATSQYSKTSGGLTDSCDWKTCDASQCAVGSYLKGCGDAEAGACVPCTNKIDGAYYTGKGTLDANDCAYESCPTCGLGNFRESCGLSSNPTSSGQCARCTNANVGTEYYVSSGEPNDATSCSKESCMLCTFVYSSVKREKINHKKNHSTNSLLKRRKYINHIFLTHITNSSYCKRNHSTKSLSIVFSSLIHSSRNKNHSTNSRFVLKTSIHTNTHTPNITQAKQTVVWDVIALDVVKMRVRTIT
jgi:hypothetical protein